MATKPALSDRQIANCRKLVAYLRTLPAGYPDFEMGTFTIDKTDYAVAVSCGTAACACGHGPIAGIEPDEDEDWFDYSYRCFVPRKEIAAWSWCFSARWSLVDNTVHGAAARIEYMLDHGVPKDADIQSIGTVPLSYAVPQAA